MCSGQDVHLSEEISTLMAAVVVVSNAAAANGSGDAGILAV